MLGCHLKKFACNAKRKDSTTTSKLISSMNIINKVHFWGHFDKWCLEHCNPNDFEDLENVRVHIYGIFYFHLEGIQPVSWWYPHYYCWILRSVSKFFSWMSKYARIIQQKNTSSSIYYTCVIFIIICTSNVFWYLYENEQCIIHRCSGKNVLLSVDCPHVCSMMSVMYNRVTHG